MKTSQTKRHATDQVDMSDVHDERANPQKDGQILKQKKHIEKQWRLAEARKYLDQVFKESFRALPAEKAEGAITEQVNSGVVQVATSPQGSGAGCLDEGCWACVQSAFLGEEQQWTALHRPLAYGFKRSDCGCACHWAKPLFAQYHPEQPRSPSSLKGEVWKRSCKDESASQPTSGPHGFCFKGEGEDREGYYPSWRQWFFIWKEEDHTAPALYECGAKLVFDRCAPSDSAPSDSAPSDCDEPFPWETQRIGTEEELWKARRLPYDHPCVCGCSGRRHGYPQYGGPVCVGQDGTGCGCSRFSPVVEACAECAESHLEDGEAWSWGCLCECHENGTAKPHARIVDKGGNAYITTIVNQIQKQSMRLEGLWPLAFPAAAYYRPGDKPLLPRGAQKLERAAVARETLGQEQGKLFGPEVEGFARPEFGTSQSLVDRFAARCALCGHYKGFHGDGGYTGIGCTQLVGREVCGCTTFEERKATS